MLRLPRLALATTLVSSMILTLALAGSVAAGGKPLVATMLPGNEPGGGDPSATAVGDFAVTVNFGHRTVCYWISFQGLSAPAAAAHIHKAPAGVNGGVVIPLSVPNATSGSSSGCIEDVSDSTLKGLLQDPTGYYVNIHTSVNPGGAIRGQLTEPED